MLATLFIRWSFQIAIMVCMPGHAPHVHLCQDKLVRFAIQLADVVLAKVYELSEWFSDAMYQ